MTARPLCGCGDLLLRRPSKSEERQKGREEKRRHKTSEKTASSTCVVVVDGCGGWLQGNVRKCVLCLYASGSEAIHVEDYKLDGPRRRQSSELKIHPGALCTTYSSALHSKFKIDDIRFLLLPSSDITPPQPADR